MAKYKPLVCPPELLAKNLGGQLIVITGANSGIGLATARQLVKQGAHVVMACRRVEEGQRAAAQILSETGAPSERVEVRELDLGDLESVRSFAKRLLQDHEAIDVLLNNAGVMNTPERKTKDGFEMQLGVNHLGHFLLTQLLIPALEKAAPSRIVNVSSCFHDNAMGREGDIDFDDLFFESREYDGWKAYAQSKLANLLHARGLADRLGDKGVTAVSVHPGWVRTELMRHSMPSFLQTIARPFMRMAGLIEPWEGCQTSLYAVLADDVPQHNGAYYSQVGTYRDKSFNQGGWPMRSPNPRAHDDAAVDKLWERSESLVGLA